MLGIRFDVTGPLHVLAMAGGRERFTATTDSKATDARYEGEVRVMRVMRVKIIWSGCEKFGVSELVMDKRPYYFLLNY